MKPVGVAIEEDDPEDEEAPAMEDSSKRVFAKEGWLNKADPKGRSWKRRWLVADRVTRTLTWYGANPRFTLSKYKVTEPAKGSMNLIDAKVITDAADLPAGAIAGSNPPAPHRFWIVAPGRVMAMTAATASECSAWVNFLERCIAGHSFRETSGLDERKPSSRHLAGESASAVASASAASAAGGGVAAEFASFIEPRLLPEVKPMAGWLMKTGSDTRLWERRWVALRPATMTLVYSTDKEGSDTRGVVDLRMSVLKPGLVDATSGGDPVMRSTPGLRLIITRPGQADRILSLAADNSYEAQQWIDAIHTAQQRAPKVVAMPGSSSSAAASAAAASAVSLSSLSLPSAAAASAAGVSSTAARARDDGDEELDEEPALPLADIPVHEGSLSKSDPNGRNWKRRHFVMVPHISKAASAPGVKPEELPGIAYFTDGKKKDHKGTVQLQTVTDIQVGAPEDVRRRAPTAFILSVVTTDRTFYMAFDSEDDLEAWRNSIMTVAEAWNDEVAAEEDAAEDADEGEDA